MRGGKITSHEAKCLSKSGLPLFEESEVSCPGKTGARHPSEVHLKNGSAVFESKFSKLLERLDLGGQTPEVDEARGLALVVVALAEGDEVL